MKYFTIEELTRTNTGIKNDITPDSLYNIMTLVKKVLDPAREAYGAPIIVNSGYRSPEVNTAIGGAKNSQHCKGEAADITCADNMKLFEILLDMEFDQLIYEHGDDNQPSWIHVSYREGNSRQQVLRSKKSGKKTVYENFKI